jgi:RNA polymerase sigma-70 factor (ECF subfamily)
VTLTDAELTSAAQAGGRRELDDLLRRHYDRIFAVCRRITGNDSDAADAAQEALISIVRSLHRFDGRSSFSTWAYRIATNASLDELRRRRRRPVLAPGDADRPQGEHVDPDAGVRIESIADRMEIDEALAALPIDFRVPIVLRDIAGLDYAEIAETLAIPTGTVKSRIARGRAQLARSLAGDDASGNQPPHHDRPRPAP